MHASSHTFVFVQHLLLLIVFICAPFLTRARVASRSSFESDLLETGSAAKVRSVAESPASIKIISYNIRWRGGDDLRKLIELLRNDAEIGQATILGLQEVDRNKKRTRNVNTARLMAEELGMYYAWAAPPPAKPQQEEETGVAIMSAYPLKDVRRIVLPHPGPNGRRRVALGVTVQMGTTSVRVYSVHAETRLAVPKKAEQLQAVLDDLHSHQPQAERVIVLGDFNTWEERAVNNTSRLFTDAGFSTPFPNDQETWKGYFIIKLKLDWIWLRGLDVISYGIDKKIKLSDHWPLWVNARMKDEGGRMK